MEDELHFLMECELFTIVRGKFFKDLSEIDPNLKSDDKKQMFISLMSTDNCVIVTKLARFINACFEIRKIINENVNLPQIVIILQHLDCRVW